MDAGSDEHLQAELLGLCCDFRLGEISPHPVFPPFCTLGIPPRCGRFFQSLCALGLVEDLFTFLKANLSLRVGT